MNTVQDGMESGSISSKQQVSSDMNCSSTSTFSLDVAHHMQSMQTFPPWPTQSNKQVQNAPLQVGDLQSHDTVAPATTGHGMQNAAAFDTGGSAGCTPDSSDPLSTANSPMLVACSFLSNVQESPAREAFRDEANIRAEQQPESANEVVAANSFSSLVQPATQGLTHATGPRSLQQDSQADVSQLPQTAGFVISSCSSKASAPARIMHFQVASHLQHQQAPQHEQQELQQPQVVQRQQPDGKKEKERSLVTDPTRDLLSFSEDEPFHARPDQAPAGVTGSGCYVPPAPKPIEELFGSRHVDAQKGDISKGQTVAGAAVKTDVGVADKGQNSPQTAGGRTGRLTGLGAASANGIDADQISPHATEEVHSTAAHSSQQGGSQSMPQRAQGRGAIGVLPVAAPTPKEQAGGLDASCCRLSPDISAEIPVSTLAGRWNLSDRLAGYLGAASEAERLPASRGIGRFCLVHDTSKFTPQTGSTGTAAERTGDKFGSSSSMPSDVSIQVLNASKYSLFHVCELCINKACMCDCIYTWRTCRTSIWCFV